MSRRRRHQVGAWLCGILGILIFLVAAANGAGPGMALGGLLFLVAVFDA